MSIISSYLRVHGVKIYCETNNGPASNGTIVCFGSAGRDTRQFHGVMDSLKDDFEVIAFDMPGHGKSWPLKENKAIAEYHEYGDFIIDTVAELRVKNPIYVGFALGGNMVFYLAQKQQVRAIVAMAGADYTPTVHSSVAELLNNPYCSVQYSHLDFTDSLIGSETSQKDREFILWGVCSETGITKVADYAGVYNNFDVRDAMKTIQCPVLMLRGEEDWTVTDNKFEAVIGRLSNAKKVVRKTFPGLSHFNPQESPGMVTDAIRDFLADC